jgi:hypothetical protein
MSSTLVKSIVVNGLKILDYYIDNAGQHRRPRFKCLCVCGNIFESRAEAIKNGTAKSCGCKTSDLMSNARTLPNNEGIVNRVYKNYEQTAVRRGIGFNLSLEEFKSFIFLDCIYCGSPPRLVVFVGSEKWGRKERVFAYNGIDRIDSSKSYIVSELPMTKVMGF